MCICVYVHNKYVWVGTALVMPQNILCKWDGKRIMCMNPSLLSPCRPVQNMINNENKARSMRCIGSVKG